MEFTTILMEHEIFGNRARSIDRTIIRSASLDGIRDYFNWKRDFWQPCSIEFLAILIEKEIFGNRDRSIDGSID